MARRTLVVAVVAAAVLVGSAGAQTVIYVDQNAGPVHDGSGWCSAYLEVPEALAAALSDTSIDRILVADGNYRPDTSGLSLPRDATFQLIDGVTLEGGYAGCGADDPDERDIDLYETILSGDLGVSGSDFDNCYHVVTGNGTDSTAVLDGFTISGGNADGPVTPRDAGGGMHIDFGSPKVLRCRFVANSADWLGGGMANKSSHPTVTACKFIDNSGTRGGGMSNVNDSHPTVTGCMFIENSAGDGGGMFNFTGSSPTVEDCTFSGNTASYGGGMYNEQSGSPAVSECTFSANLASVMGGGMYNKYYCIPTVSNCTFGGNTADSGGGGIYNEHHSSPTLANCLFAWNSAVAGGGLSNDDYSNPTLGNCTLSGNSAWWGGGIHNWSNCTPTLANCIVWGNLPLAGAEIWDEPGAVTTARYSCVRDGWPGVGNTDADPHFADADGSDDIPSTWEDNDYRLAGGSPSIDAADNAAVLPDANDLDDDDDVSEPTPYDRDGIARFFDDVVTPDTGVGEPPIVDMGAYEYSFVAGDMDGDLDVDGDDFGRFADCLAGPGAEPPPDCDLAILDGDGDVDLADFAAVQQGFTGPLP